MAALVVAVALLLGSSVPVGAQDPTEPPTEVDLPAVVDLYRHYVEETTYTWVLEPLTLQDWTPSGQVPIGAPFELRLGVWANDKEIRLFVNDVYQFTITDPALKVGSVGVFVRATGSNAVTVNFRDLVIYSLNGD